MTIRSVYPSELSREVAHRLQLDATATRQALCAYLDTLVITSDNIGPIRASLLRPVVCEWNGWVRDDTAERENLRAIETRKCAQLYRELTDAYRIVHAWQLPVFEDKTDPQEYLAECLAIARWCGGISHMMRDDNPGIEVPWGSIPVQPGWWISFAGGNEWRMWLDHAFRMNHRQETGLTAAELRQRRIDDLERQAEEEEHAAELAEKLRRASLPWWKRVVDFLSRRRRK